MTVPPGYTMLREGGVRAVIRSDLVTELAPWLLAPELTVPLGAERLAAGRGGAYRHRLPSGRAVVLRICRRGGVLGPLRGETYVGVRPRPLRELVATAEIRRRGVAAPEVLAARVAGGLVYRGALLTAEVTGACTLVEALRRAPDAPSRRRLARSAARAVAHLHDAGVLHADLNLMNILVHGQGGADVALCDFDRARLRPHPLGRMDRRRSLRRLGRSLARLDPSGMLVGPAEREAFHATYTAISGERCAS